MKLFATMTLWRFAWGMQEASFLGGSVARQFLTTSPLVTNCGSSLEVMRTPQGKDLWLIIVQVRQGLFHNGCIACYCELKESDKHHDELHRMLL